MFTTISSIGIGAGSLFLKLSLTNLFTVYKATKHTREVNEVVRFEY